MWHTQLQSLKVLRLTVKEEMHLHENTLFDPVPSTHVIYAPAKFDVDISNALEGDTFTRKYII